MRKIVSFTSLLTLVVFFYQCSTQKQIVKGEYKLESAADVKDYAETITSEELKEHLYILASDKFKGRETGKEGQKLAEEYLVNEFEKYGVKPGNGDTYLQEFELIESLPPTANFQFKGNQYYFLKHFYFFPSMATFESFQVPLSEVYDVQYGVKTEKRDDYGNIKVNNKVVIARLDNPADVSNTVWNWRKKIDIAKNEGAKCILFISDDVESEIERLHHYLDQATMKLKDDNVETRSSNNIPFFFISQDMYTEIMVDGEGKEEKEEPDYLEFNIDLVSNELTSSNVLGFIEGSDEKLKNEIIIITAHYDHIGVKGQEVYNGADDDGSGTVALLEIAEAFQKAKNDGKGPKRSILVMPVSGEEKGLLGSSYYASNPIYPLENTVVDLNVDMIGRVDKKYEGNPDYVYLIGADRISQELHDLNEAVNKTYMNLTLDYTYNEKNDPNRYYYRSDHYNFAKNGIPVIFYFNGTHEDYHEPTDTFEKIDFDKIEKITQLIFYTAWEIANKEERLKIDK